MANVHAHLPLGLSEQLQDLGVIVDSLVEAVVVGVHHLVHQAIDCLKLLPQLQESFRPQCQQMT